MYATEVKPWTFLVYMTAANELSSQALNDLQDMIKVGSNQHVNILVYLTIKQRGRSKETRKLYVEKGEVRQIGPVISRDSGDVSALVDALQWACLDYPSEHIVVNLWSGKSEPLNRKSSKGLCHDDETGHYLTDRDCLTAFSWVKDIMRGGKKFDIILCDACLLGSLEMAYTFADCANYYIASEEFIPDKAFQYGALLRLLGPSIDVYSFVKSIINSYAKANTGSTLYTLSAIDLNELDLLINNINAIAHILASQLRSKYGNVVKATIKKCVGTSLCPSFEKGIYIDLCQFYKNIFKVMGNMKLSKTVSQQFRELLQTGIELFSTVVKMKTTSKQYKQQPGGLSIYFNKHHIHPSYYGLYWTEKNPQWLDFLEAYLE